MKKLFLIMVILLSIFAISYARNDRTSASPKGRYEVISMRDVDFTISGVRDSRNTIGVETISVVNGDVKGSVRVNEHSRGPISANQLENQLTKSIRSKKNTRMLDFRSSRINVNVGRNNNDVTATIILKAMDGYRFQKDDDTIRIQFTVRGERFVK